MRRAVCAEPADAPYAPNRLTLAIPPDAALPGLLAERRAGASPVIAYVCAGLHCPIAVLDDLERALEPVAIAAS